MRAGSARARPNFVLVKSRLKLIDFGVANAIQTDTTINVHRETMAGTPSYMAPESLMDSTRYAFIAFLANHRLLILLVYLIDEQCTVGELCAWRRVSAALRAGSAASTSAWVRAAPVPTRS